MRLPHYRLPDRPPAAVAWLVGIAAAVGAVSVVLGIVSLVSDNHTRTVNALSAVVIAAGPCVWVLAWLAGRWLHGLARRAAEVTRRLEGAAATGHELVWEITPDGTVTYMSRVAREMFGVDPHEVIGQSVFVLLPPDEHPRARGLLADAVRERRGWNGLTFQALHATDGLRWVETTGMPHLDNTGQVTGFTATTRSLDAQAMERIALARTRDRVATVVSQRCIRTVFQPIVDMDSGRVIGHEALSRIDAEPAQPPDRWFADAEACGLAVDLDCLAVQTALFTAQRLPDDTYISVNVTPATLKEPRLLEILQACDIPGNRIVLEITEHVSVGDYQPLRAPLAELRGLGVRLAVDDAGSGYASFRHILRLRPEFIKIDQEIIRGVHDDPARRALTAAVVMFALDVDAQVTAEGVETADDLQMVAALGIDAAQGFLLGRPTDDPREWRVSVRRLGVRGLEIDETA